MRNVIRIAGGTVLAAAAVILIFRFYTGIVMPKLKEEAGREGKGEIQAGAAMEEAVLSNPVLSWRGTSCIQAGEDYPLWEKVFVQDVHDGYEKSLKEAVEEEKIQVQEMQILDPEGTKSANASVDFESGIVRMEKSGIYRMHIKGMDKHNNTVQAEFLLAVNRKGEDE